RGGVSPSVSRLPRVRGPTPAFQRCLARAVLLPERFRGGCPFGAPCWRHGVSPAQGRRHVLWDAPTQTRPASPSPAPGGPGGGSGATPGVPLRYARLTWDMTGRGPRTGRVRAGDARRPGGRAPLDCAPPVLGR